MSVAKAHFPLFRRNGDHRSIFDPVRRKDLTNSPEERVRQQWIQYLTLECGHPLSRLSVENGLRIPQEEHESRSDLLLYDAEFKPLLLLELKAEHIPIQQKTMIQARRYNQTIKAPYILLSNGKIDVLSDESGTLLDGHYWPEFLTSRQPVHRLFDYWNRRGFLSKEDTSAMRWLQEQMTRLPSWVSFGLNIDGITAHYAFVEKIGDYWQAKTLFVGASGVTHLWISRIDTQGERKSIVCRLWSEHLSFELYSEKGNKETFPIEGGDQDLAVLERELIQAF